jgi:hypothetical protein
MKSSKRSCLKQASQKESSKSTEPDSPIHSTFSGVAYSDTTRRSPKRVEFAERVEIKNFGDTPDPESPESLASTQSISPAIEENMSDEMLSVSMDSLVIDPRNIAGVQAPAKVVTPDLIRESKLNYRADKRPLQPISANVECGKFRFHNIFKGSNKPLNSASSLQSNETEVYEHVEAENIQSIPLGKLKADEREHENPNVSSKWIKIKSRSPNIKMKNRILVGGIQKKSPLPRFVKVKRSPHRALLSASSVHTTPGHLPPRPKTPTRVNTLAEKPSQTPCNNNSISGWLLDEENTPWWWQENRAHAHSKIPLSELRKLSTDAVAENALYDEELDGKICEITRKTSTLSKIKGIQELGLRDLSDQDFNWATEK